jgi:hypothetical protein
MSDDNSRVSVLEPRPGMLPPQGCGGAVTGWPQLLHAVRTLGSPAETQIGSNMRLMAALAANPTMLTAPGVPHDLYSQFVWFVIKVWSQARTMAGTLRHLPALLSTDPSLLAEVLTGPHGLQEGAAAIAAVAVEMEARVTAVHSSGELTAKAALAERATADLQRHAHEAAEAQPLEKALLESRAAEAAQRVRMDLEHLQTGAAAAAADAVLANLARVFASTATEWRALAETLATAAATDPGQLGDLDRAAAAWSDYAGAIRDFITRLLSNPD